MYKKECTAKFSDECQGEFTPSANEAVVIRAAIIAGYKAKFRHWIFSMSGTVCPPCAHMIVIMDADEETKANDWIDPVTGEAIRQS